MKGNYGDILFKNYEEIDWLKLRAVVEQQIAGVVATRKLLELVQNTRNVRHHDTTRSATYRAIPPSRHLASSLSATYFEWQACICHKKYICILIGIAFYFYSAIFTTTTTDTTIV